MDEEHDSEIIVDDGDGLDENIDISIEPNTWDNVPETEAEPDGDDWDLGDLTMDDDDMIENDSNEDEIIISEEPASDPDTEDDLEESEPEDVPDDPEDDEESAPE